MSGQGDGRETGTGRLETQRKKRKGGVTPQMMEFHRTPKGSNIRKKTKGKRRIMGSDLFLGKKGR